MIPTREAVERLCERVGSGAHKLSAGCASCQRITEDLDALLAALRAVTEAKTRQLLADWEEELRLARASDTQAIAQLRRAVAHAAYRTHGATEDCDGCREVTAAVAAARQRP